MLRFKNKYGFLDSLLRKNEVFLLQPPQPHCWTLFHMNRCNVYVAGICVEVIASYLISIPQSQIVSAGYRHQKILICNTIQNHSIDFLHTLRIRSGVQFCEKFQDSQRKQRTGRGSDHP